MKEGTVCFHIHGEDFTRLVRSLWADEQAPERALRILEAGLPDMGFEDRLSVLTGRKKLVGDSRDGGLGLEEDSTAQSPHGNALSVEAVIGSFRSQIHDLKARERTLLDSWREEEAEKERERLEEELETQKELQEERVAQMQEEADRAEPRKPPKYKRSITGQSGWLSPKGKFYPCGYMEHISMAGRLGKNELDLEERGWVKIQNGTAFRPGGLRHDLPATQRQIDLLFDWCTARGEELPYWLKNQLKEG